MIVIELFDMRGVTYVGGVRGDTFKARDVLKSCRLAWQPARAWHDDPAKRVGYWFSHVDRELTTLNELAGALVRAGIEDFRIAPHV